MLFGWWDHLRRTSHTASIQSETIILCVSGPIAQNAIS